MFKRSLGKGSNSQSQENSDEESSQAWQNTAECSVCFAPFSASKRRYHCHVCLSSVCNLHSLKRRLINSQFVRACDLCERSRFEEEVRRETSAKVGRLKEELEVVKRELEETQREIEEKEGEILSVQMKWNEHLTAATAEEERLETSIALELQHSVESQRLLSVLDHEASQSSHREASTRELMTSRELSLATLQSETQEDSSSLDSQLTLLNSLTKKANRCVDWKVADEVLCRGCRQRLKRPMEESTCELRSFREFAEASRASSM